MKRWHPQNLGLFICSSSQPSSSAKKSWGKGVLKTDYVYTPAEPWFLCHTSPYRTSKNSCVQHHRHAVENYLTLKRNEPLTEVTWGKQRNIMVSKRSQMQKIHTVCLIFTGNSNPGKTHLGWQINVCLELGTGGWLHGGTRNVLKWWKCVLIRTVATQEYLFVKASKWGHSVVC